MIKTTFIIEIEKKLSSQRIKKFKLFFNDKYDFKSLPLIIHIKGFQRHYCNKAIFYHPHPFLKYSVSLKNSWP